MKKKELQNPDKKSRIILINPKDAKKFMAKVINQCFDDRIDDNKVKTLCTAVNTFLRCFEIGEVTERLDELEARIDAK